MLGLTRPPEPSHFNSFILCYDIATISLPGCAIPHTLIQWKKVSVSSFVPDSPLFFFPFLFFFFLNVRFSPFLLLPLSPCTRVQLATAGELIITGIVIIIIVIGVSRSTLLRRLPANTAAALIAGSGTSCRTTFNNYLVHFHSKTAIH